MFIYLKQESVSAAYASSLPRQDLLVRTEKNNVVPTANSLSDFSFILQIFILLSIGHDTPQIKSKKKKKKKQKKTKQKKNKQKKTNKKKQKKKNNKKQKQTKTTSSSSNNNNNKQTKNKTKTNTKNETKQKKQKQQQQNKQWFNPLTANHNKCRLLCHLLVILKVIFANSVDPDQTAPPLGAVWSGSTLGTV